MRNKIITLFLSCILCFSSVGRSYADVNSRSITASGMSIAMATVVGTVAVASGLSFDDEGQLATFLRGFNNYHKEKEILKDLFISYVKVGVDNVISVGNEFLELVNEYIEYFSKGSASVIPCGYSGHIPIYTSNPSSSSDPELFNIDISLLNIGTKYYLSNNLYFILDSKSTDNNKATFYIVDGDSVLYTSSKVALKDYLELYLHKNSSNQLTLKRLGNVSIVSLYSHLTPFITSKPSFGNVNWENNISANLKDNKLDLNVPKDINNLVGLSTNGAISVLTPNPSFEKTDGTFKDVTSIGNGTISLDKDSISSGVTDTPTDTPIDTPSLSFPSFGDSLDFSPLYVTNIKDKFPFSLPWDLAELFNVFDVDPQAPIFKFPILGEELIIDLTIFDEWASIGRFFVLIGFVVFLIFATIKIRG